MSEPSVAVVILNWNGLGLLTRFLASVTKSNYTNLRIVVGDNASTDGSLAYVRENFPTVNLIVNEINYGFAEGYNRILQQVDADYYVLLNSDVAVPVDWIRPVIRMMEADLQIAVAQPKIKWEQDKQSFEYAGAAGGFIDINGFPFCRGRIFDLLEHDHGQYDDAREIFWASGAAFFIRQKQWKQSGGLDPDLFAHMEEIDLCWRLKNMGYKIAYCPKAEVYHLGGGTLDAGNPFKVFLNFRNNLIIMQKNLPYPEAIWRIALRMSIDFVAWLQFMVTGKAKFSIAISKAHYQFLRSWRRTSKKRSAALTPLTSHQGVFKSSIVWNYFIKRIKYFSGLKDFQ